MMTKRNLVGVFFLMIFTCGLYYIYWLAMTTNEIEKELGSDSDGSCSSGGVAVLLTILTCGLYSFYWYYKQAKRLVDIGRIHRMNLSDDGLLYIVLNLFGLSIVNMIILQSNVNKIVDDSNRGNSGNNHYGQNNYNRQNNNREYYDNNNQNVDYNYPPSHDPRDSRDDNYPPSRNDNDGGNSNTKY